MIAKKYRVKSKARRGDGVVLYFPQYSFLGLWFNFGNDYLYNQYVQFLELGEACAYIALEKHKDASYQENKHLDGVVQECCR